MDSPNTYWGDAGLDCLLIPQPAAGTFLLLPQASMKGREWFIMGHSIHFLTIKINVKPV
jgi:hypothetical protein